MANQIVDLEDVIETLTAHLTDRKPITDRGQGVLDKAIESAECAQDGLGERDYLGLLLELCYLWRAEGDTLEALNSDLKYVARACGMRETLQVNMR